MSPERHYQEWNAYPDVRFIYLEYPPAGWKKRLVWKISVRNCPPPLREGSSIGDEPFTIILPNGLRFGCLSMRGEGFDYVPYLEAYADEQRLLTGKVQDGLFCLSNGDSIPLSEVTFIDAYILDGKQAGSTSDKLGRG